MLWLTHWGRMTHICVSKLSIIGSENGLSPGRRQAIIWTSAGIMLIGSLGTNFSEILIGIQTFSFKKMQLKMASAKWRLFCLGLNVLIVVRVQSNSALFEIHLFRDYASTIHLESYAHYKMSYMVYHIQLSHYSIVTDDRCLVYAYGNRC